MHLIGMTDDSLDRSKITFEQAEGVEPLPQQLKLREISAELRAKLWLVIYEELDSATQYSTMGGVEPWLSDRWKAIIFDWHTLRLHRMADEFRNDAKARIRDIKNVVTSDDYVKVFGFVQFLVRHRNCPHQLRQKIAWALASSRAAYRLVEQTIMPSATEEEGAVITRAFADLNASEFGGARAHLRQAAEYLTSGDYASSIRESIHAVEAVAGVIEPGARMLGPALMKLEKAGRLNPNLKRGFNALYDYTSDERGVRHSLIDESIAAVDEADAVYMLGACAAFVGFLVNKGRLQAPQPALSA